MDEEADTQWCSAHAGQLEAIGLPHALHLQLAAKLRLQQFDAGASIAFAHTAGQSNPRESWGVQATRDIGAGEEVWLSDHIWLYQGPVAGRQQIATVPELRGRLAILLGLDPPADQDVDGLLMGVSHLSHPMKLQGPDGQHQEYYYVSDEFGSRIGFAGVDQSPNVGAAAFMDAGSGTTYTVAWPIQAISEGSKLVRAAVKSMALIAEGGRALYCTLTMLYDSASLSCAPLLAHHLFALLSHSSSYGCIVSSSGCIVRERLLGT